MQLRFFKVETLLNNCLKLEMSYLSNLTSLSVVKQLNILEANVSY